MDTPGNLTSVPTEVVIDRNELAAVGPGRGASHTGRAGAHESTRERAGIFLRDADNFSRYLVPTSGWLRKSALWRP